MANRFNDRPPLESKTPDPAATGSSAEITDLAGGSDRHNTSADAPQSAPPVVTRYGPTLDALRPGCRDRERRLRCGILYLRDQATAAVRVAGWEAAMILHAIESLASVHAYASMPATELDELHHGMTRLMGVAMALDMRGPRAGAMA